LDGVVARAWVVFDQKNSLPSDFSVTFAPFYREGCQGSSRIQLNSEAFAAMVTIRLTRRGAKKQPFYHVVVTDSRMRQGGTTLEQVGYFNPVPAGKQRRLELNLDRIDYWVGKGAKPSERVAELVKKHRKQAAAA
jgi:small subunit ribosomal protein S16